MPWKECHVTDERLRFVARLLDVEAMARTDRDTRRLSQVTLGERHTGSRLQVPLEQERAPLVAEFDDDIDAPGPARRGMRTRAVVVSTESRPHVRRDAGAEARWTALSTKDVDEPLQHVDDRCKPTAFRCRPRLLRFRVASQQIVANLARTHTDAVRDSCGHECRHCVNGPPSLARRAMVDILRMTWACLACSPPLLAARATVDILRMTSARVVCSPPSLTARAMVDILRMTSARVACHPKLAEGERRMEAPPGFEPGMEVLQTVQDCG